MSKKISQSKRIAAVEPINWVLLVLSLILLSGSTVMTWLSLQPGTTQAEVTTEVQSEITAAKARQFDAPEIPTLKLNKKNLRQGPEVVVNPDAIGKDNPFAK
ncbi:hypothetical protein BH11PAT4_BH11PAT4_4940 [soil metagenome]